MTEEKVQDESNTSEDAEAMLLTEIEQQNAKMQEEIGVLNTQISQSHDKLLRAMAEAENVRRRYEKMVEDAKDYAVVNFCKDLLAVMDNLTRALEHAPQNPDAQTAGVIAGVVMTKDEMTTVFKKHGLETIQPAQGEKFDYNLHHAISQIVTDDHDHDSIVGVMQVGYRIKDRLLRPAIVSVAKKIDNK